MKYLRALPIFALIAALLAVGGAFGTENPPAFPGPDPNYLSVQAYLIAQIKASVPKLNQDRLDAYRRFAADWLANAERARDLGLPEPPKTMAPPKELVAVEVAQPKYQDGRPNYNLFPIELREGAPLCPEVVLAPLPPKPPAANVQIGQLLWGQYYQAGPQDTCPDGYQAIKDGSVYIKRALFGPRPDGTQPGWWIKQ